MLSEVFQIVSRGDPEDVFAKLFLLAALLIASSPMAIAQPLEGPYVSGSAGLALPSFQTEGSNSPKGDPSAGITSPSVDANKELNSGLGGTQSASGGWGFGNGVRVEIQGMHTQQSVGGNSP